jgi:hypothetical protein
MLFIIDEASCTTFTGYGYAAEFGRLRVGYRRNLTVVLR